MPQPPVLVPSSLLTLVLIAAGCGGPGSRGAKTTVENSDFDAILRACSRADGVDWLLLRRDHLPALDAYLARLAEIDIDALPRDEQLALCLNAYNAHAMRAIASRLRAGYSVAENDFALFKEPLVRLGGETMSLEHLEDEWIRKRYRDPRVHVALNCGARSCPALGEEAYTGSGLDARLEASMRGFLADPQHNAVDRESGEVSLSPLFDWYAEDFGGEGKVPGYVGKYLKGDVKGLRIVHEEYDWRLSFAPLPPGHPWRVVAAKEVEARLARGGSARLERNEIVEWLADDGDRARIRLGDGREAVVKAAALDVFEPG
jgi:hypothetical protein